MATVASERFTMVQQLGAGGMGTVWKAIDRQSGETVAVKLIHPAMADDPEYLRRFGNEVEFLRRISSPYVARVHGYGKSAGSPYFAMEFVEGPSLADVVQQRVQAGRLFSWDEARSIGADIARALQATHVAGVTHRDVKPGNVLFSLDGRVKLVDFGVARGEAMTSHTMGPIGTLAYMAPDRRTSPRSDLYALGCVLFEMVCGAPPFSGRTVTEFFRAHAFQRPPLHLLPPEARPAIKALLEKKPEHRPADAAAVVALLEAVPPAKPATSAKPATPAFFAARPAPRPSAPAGRRARAWRPTPFWAVRLAISLTVLSTTLSLMHH